MSRNAYMKWDEIKSPHLDSSDVFCVFCIYFMFHVEIFIKKLTNESECIQYIGFARHQRRTLGRKSWFLNKISKDS